jgi:enoyl-CoA hydratase/carnithine racemase
MELKVTRYDVADGIGQITLNRPDRLNAWTGRMHAEYRHSLAAADVDPAVRVIVVTGAGRGFCVGGDAAALAGHVRKGGYDPGTPEPMATPGGGGTVAEFNAAFAYHFALRKPIIAAMNGPAAGVGLALACFADIRFAAAGAKFTTAHGKLNLPAEYGLSWLLPRMIGLTRANDLLLSSRVFLAEEAMALGIVNGVFAAERVLPEARAYGQRLIETVAPGSLQATRRQIYLDLHRGIGAAVDDSEVLLRRMMKEPDYAEGVAAFLAKRPAVWGIDQS